MRLVPRTLSLAPVLAVVLAAAGVLAAGADAQQAPDPERCRTHPEWRQLDFWIGTWDVVHPEDGRPLGVNVIEPVLNHCALVERWTAARGGTGTSLNFYDPQRRTWRQVWVDAFGNVLDYRAGEFRDRAMRFSGVSLGPDGDSTFQKLTFHHVAADTVRQVFESSKDRGATWTVDWVGIYIRTAPPDPGARD
ncbi:MAG TPA: hypothetical protein VMM12_05500 [Longimicrobiales bacterium]|nr:hypothetical protein [Longimicrobiales bacterium]